MTLTADISPIQGGCVLLDLDGTLLDTAPDFMAVLTAMAEQHKAPEPLLSTIYSTVSSGARALVEACFGVLPEQDGFQPLLDELLERYGQQILHSEARLYPGLGEVLADLEARDIHWGIVTNKPERFSVPLVRALALEERCSVLICPDHVSRSKPDPEGLLLAAHTLGCDPEQSIYVGDHPRDITAGLLAGMHTVAAAYGYLPPEPPIHTWGAHHVIQHGAELGHNPELRRLRSSASYEHFS